MLPEGVVELLVDFFAFWKKKVTRLLAILFLGLAIDGSLSEQEESDNGLFLLILLSTFSIVMSLPGVGGY